MSKISMDFVFSVDLEDKALSNMLKRFHEPVPFFKDAMKLTLTATTDRLMTDEEQAKFIEISEKTYEGVESDTMVIREIHFLRTENVHYAPDAEK